MVLALFNSVDDMPIIGKTMLMKQIFILAYEIPFSIYYVENNETGYRIELMQGSPAILSQPWDGMPTNITESITIGEKTYWYNSTFENNITKFQEI